MGFNKFILNIRMLVKDDEKNKIFYHISVLFQAFGFLEKNFNNESGIFLFIV